MAAGNKRHQRFILDSIVLSDLGIKSDREPSTSFSGNPKKATVTFGTAFPDTNYVVIATPEATGGVGSFILSIESKTVSDFVLNANTNNISGLTAAFWIATKISNT